MITLTALITACASGPEQTATPTTDSTKKETTVDLSNNPDYQKGLEVAGNNDCFTCHQVDEQLTGPAYKDIANKYATAGDTIVNYLSAKIINGGSGVWGSVPMAPHPSITQEEAQALAKYVLLLKK